MLVVLCDVKQIGNIEAMTDMKMDKTCPSEKDKIILGMPISIAALFGVFCLWGYFGSEIFVFKSLIYPPPPDRAFYARGG